MIDDIIESIRVELCIDKRRNVIISCIYRTPGYNVEAFNDQLEIIIKKTNPHKSIFLCGDFNLDLLTYSNNLSTKHFVDMMFSLGMFSLINKPSRTTDITATLIYNIFTKEFTDNITSGLLINDISDHLPATCRYSGMNRHVIISTLVKKIDKDSIESLKSYL